MHFDKFLYEDNQAHICKIAWSLSYKYKVIVHQYCHFYHLFKTVNLYSSNLSSLRRDTKYEIFQ